MRLRDFKNYTNEWLQNHINNYSSVAEIFRVFDIAYGGSSIHRFRQQMEDRSIDLTHLKGAGWSFGKAYYSIEELFVKGKYISNSVLIKYLLRFNLMEKVCSECGNTGWWRDKPLIIELDHIDGDRCNSRLENLRFLCLPYHSQTQTYRKKKNTKPQKKAEQKKCDLCNNLVYQKSKICKSCSNKRLGLIQKQKREKTIYKCEVCAKEVSFKAKTCAACRPYGRLTLDKEELQILIEKLPMTSIGKIYGVSDNAVLKRCRVLQVDLSKRKIKQNGRVGK